MIPGSSPQTRENPSPGESRTVRLEVPVSELGYHGRGNRYVVEPGEFAVWIGPSSAEGLEGRFWVA